MPPKNYIFEDMTLSQLLALLVDHGFPFEQQRGLTMTQMYDALKRINAGEIKSLDELDAERRAEVEKRGKRK